MERKQAVAANFAMDKRAPAAVNVGRDQIDRQGRAAPVARGRPGRRADGATPGTRRAGIACPGARSADPNAPPDDEAAMSLPKRLLPAIAVAGLATPALAHHPLGGMAMETFAQGVLSGVGHPVLGFDHLFFVALVGVAALFTGRALSAPAAYIAAMLAGCLLMIAGVAMPIAETVIGLSLLTLGVVTLSGARMSAPVAMALFAGFGLFHGAAFGEAIVGQEAGAPTPVILGYLIGLAAVQYAMAVGAGVIAEKVFAATDAQAVSARIAGAMVAGAGLLLTLENAEGVVFGALGWAA